MGAGARHVHGVGFDSTGVAQVNGGGIGWGGDVVGRRQRVQALLDGRGQLAEQDRLADAGVNGAGASQVAGAAEPAAKSAAKSAAEPVVESVGPGQQTPAFQASNANAAGTLVAENRGRAWPGRVYA